MQKDELWQLLSHAYADDEVKQDESFITADYFSISKGIR